MKTLCYEMIRENKRDVNYLHKLFSGSLSFSSVSNTENFFRDFKVHKKRYVILVSFQNGQKPAQSFML